MIRLDSPRLLLFLAAPLLFSLPAPAPSSAQSTTDWSTRFRMILDDRQFTGPVGAAEFAGDLAYFPREGRFEIWDFSSPSHPVPRGNVAIGLGFSTCVSSSGGLAVVGQYAANRTSFTILGVSDPDAPVILADVEIDRSIVDAEIVGDFLYVVPDLAALKVWDITDPTAPQFWGTLLPGVSIRSIDALGTMLYVAAARRVYAIDLSNPEIPDTRSSFWHPDPRSLFEFVAVAVGDDPTRVIATSYYDASGNYDEVRISALDMTPPPPAIETAFVTECPGIPEHVAIDGNLAFVAFSTASSQIAYRHAGIQVVDFSVPGAAETIASAGVEAGEARGVAVVGENVVLVEAGSQPQTALQVFDASPPNGVPSTGSIDGRATALDASADYLFVVIDRELQIHDARVPGFPFLRSIPLGFTYWREALTHVGDVVISGRRNGDLGGWIDAYNVSNHGTPQLLGSAEIAGYPNEVAVEDGIAYVSAYAECCCDDYGMNCLAAGGLCAVDVTGPSAPALLGELPFSCWPWAGIAPCGSRLYAARGCELQVYDISVPGTFTLLGEVALGGFQRTGVGCLAVRGDVLFGAFSSHPAASADGFATACVAFSLADPNQPEEVGYVALPGDTIDDLVVDGDMVYVANGIASVIAIDAANPESLSIVGHFAAGPSAKELAIESGGLFVANESAHGYTSVPRVWRMPRHVAAAAVGAPAPAAVGGLGSSLCIRPNPTNGNASLEFSLPASGLVRLEIVDVRGRLVRLITDGWSDAGPREFVWDGRDQAHRTTAAGVYFVRLVEGSRIETRKLTRLR
jgi:hypothetical protein